MLDTRIRVIRAASLKYPGSSRIMHDEFVSEAIEPLAGSADTTAMSRGEPGVPRAFTWRGATYTVAGVEQTWKTSTPDRGELYLRRHWFRILTTGGDQMTLYCERQTRKRNKPKARWWLYSLRPQPS